MWLEPRVWVWVRSCDRTTEFMFTKKVETEEDPNPSPQELTVSVFDNPAGLELLGHWMAAAGITSWRHSQNEEARIRKDELQRFVHGILMNLAMTPDQIREAAIARHEQRHKKQAAYE